MQKIGIHWFLLFILVNLMACGKDQIEVESWEVPDEPQIIVESARLVTGITDENGLPVEGLTAAFNDTIRLVDNGDYFQFKGSQLNKSGEVLRLTDKEGRQYYFTQRPIENEVNYFQQVIIRNKSSILHKSHNALDLSLDNQTRIKIEANQYRKSVQSYSGDVVVEHYTFDTKKENHRAALPGGITGIDQFGKRGLLEMVSAFSITCKTPNVENLEFSSGNLTSSYLNGENALFYYNEKAHNWEEVVGSGSGSASVSINKSGYYCIAAIVPYVSVSGKLKIGANPAPNQKVKLSYDGFDQTVFTSNGGKWQALIPAGEVVQYRYDLSCYQTSHTISASEKDVTLEEDQPNQDVQTTQFTGKLLNCSGKALVNGFVQIEGNDFYSILYLENGEIDFAMPHCTTNEIRIRAYDAEGGETGPWIDWQPGYNNRIYNLFACEQMTNPYLEVHNAEGSVFYSQLNQTLVQGRLQLEAKDQSDQSNFLSLIFPVSDKGILPNERINLTWKDKTFADKGISVSCIFSNNCGFENFELTHLALEQEGWVRGQFKARFWSKILNTLQAGYVEVEGSFQFRRSF